MHGHAYLMSNIFLFVGGLPHDCMPKGSQVTFALCFVQVFFTLDEYKRLANFNYGYCDNDRPVPVLCTKFSKDTTMHSSAAQMLTLFQNLPTMIGPKIPGDENWSCFLLLRKFLDIIVCPILPSSICATLKSLIIERHSLLFTLWQQ